MNAIERPASSGKAKILIVDDHPITRNGLRQLIEQQPNLEVCAEANSVHDAMVRFDEVWPDLVLLDLSLPDGTGWDVIKRLRQRWLGARILIVSGWDRINAAAAIEANAKGFLNKYDANDKLIDAIQTVLNDQTYPTARSTVRCASWMA